MKRRQQSLRQFRNGFAGEFYMRYAHVSYLLPISIQPVHPHAGRWPESI